MAKRKRPAVAEQPVKSAKQTPSTETASKATNGSSQTSTSTIQVVIGSYERALHGFTASISNDTQKTESENTEKTSRVNFTDTFLFNAHSSAIRCVAVSPPSGHDNSRITLASGSTDERINLYQLSATPPSLDSKPSLPSLTGIAALENSKNREIGSLLHHSSSITRLFFPSKSKLLSASEDSTVAIARTNDWTVLSTIKAPIPKPIGRPSGDTAAPGEVPAGVNDFAVHPSQKLMLTVGKGERCMRLWDLTRSKKAGVLNFGRETLQQAGEGKFSSGEGRRVDFDQDGEEFFVAFERGGVVYSLDSVPRGLIALSPRTKIHQARYLPRLPGVEKRILAISTEDGRVILYDTQQTTAAPDATDDDSKIPSCAVLAEIGGVAAGIAGRIKDFVAIPTGLEGPDADVCSIITGSSDGAVRVWTLPGAMLVANEGEKTNGEGTSRVASLAGTYETGHRITCLTAFLMSGTSDLSKNGTEPTSTKSEHSDDEDDV